MGKRAKVCIGLANAWIMMLNTFLHALEIGRGINDPCIVVECLIGMVHEDKVEYLAEALEIGRSIKDLRVQSEELYLLGSSKRVPDPVQWYFEAIEIV